MFRMKKPSQNFGFGLPDGIQRYAEWRGLFIEKGNKFIPLFGLDFFYIPNYIFLVFIYIVD